MHALLILYVFAGPTIVGTIPAYPFVDMKACLESGPVMVAMPKTPPNGAAWQWMCVPIVPPPEVRPT